MRDDETLRSEKGAALTHAEVDANFSRLMYWSGPWAAGDYEANEVVTDSGWTMIANKLTSERPAPQPIGDPVFGYSGTDPTSQQTASQVIFGSRYTAQQNVFLNAYRVYTIAGNAYRVFSVFGGVISEIASFTAAQTGWISQPWNRTIVPMGSQFDLLATVSEPDPTPTVWNANYDYDTPNNPGTPASGVIEQANTQQAFLRVHKTDNDGGDRSAQLLALTVGDIIQGPNIRWSIQSVSDSGTYVTFGVSPATQDSPDGVFNFGFETVTATPITYLRDVNYYIANPAVQGLEGIDVPYDQITPDDNAYGIDLETQAASISGDWEIVAYSN